MPSILAEGAILLDLIIYLHKTDSNCCRGLYTCKG